LQKTQEFFGQDMFVKEPQHIGLLDQGTWHNCVVYLRWDDIAFNCHNLGTLQKIMVYLTKQSNNHN